jgi:hypothetical protein
MRSLVLGFIVIALLGCSSVPARSFASNAEPPSNPWELMNQISEGNYFDPTLNLNRFREHYVGSDLKWSYLQVLATDLSYVGLYAEAQKNFEMTSSGGSPLEGPQDISLYDALDAVGAISQMAQGSQVVMLNEAHHVPETRGLTAALLRPLYQQGFRYLAAETFNELSVIEATKKGIPLRGTGFYSVEPLFADIVREALKLGFKIVAYEYMDSCDYVADPKGCQDKREKGQAQNLISRILKSDPQAKILIHAGYGHIDETGGSYNFPWVPMARYFKELSGINPLTIDQTEFRSRSRDAVETKGYRRLVQKYQPVAPIVLKEKGSTQFWTGMQGHYDIQVILPSSSRDATRPSWLNAIVGRKAIPVGLSGCHSFPCLVQAVLKSEIAEQYVPLDQIYIDSPTDKTVLNLKTGKYVLRFVDGDGVSENEFEVPNG